MKSQSKPSLYPPLPFHAIRAFSLLSTLITSGILSYFCYHLKVDGFKLPWTFLIMLIAALLSIISLVLTSILQCCQSRPSPLFNMVLNVPVLICWTVGMALLIYNMYGTLGHSCSISLWASTDGLMICKTYKALFAFVVLGWISQIALIVLDVRAKQQERALGAYNNLQDLQKGDSAMKLDQLHNRNESTSFMSTGTGHSVENEIPYGIIDQHHQRPHAVRAHSSYHDEPNYNSGYDHAQQVRMNDFNYYTHSGQTGYDPRTYGYNDRRY